MRYENVVKIEEKFNDVYVYMQTPSGKDVKKVSVNNYFYIKASDTNKIDSCDFEFTKENINEKSLYGDSLIKIIPINKHFWKLRKWLREVGVETFEARMRVSLRFLLDNEVIFTRRRNVGLLDIETEFDTDRKGLDVINTPIPINLITFYSYRDDKYYTFALNTRDGKEYVEEKDNTLIHYYSSEVELLKEFCDAFREQEFDIVGGWNVINYDFVYIINRMNRIGFPVSLLSNFSKHNDVEISNLDYSESKYKSYDVTIPGIDLVDLIDVMKKANAYSEKPASFSLKSTVEWYLPGEEKSGIGSSMEEYVEYNIHDVRLVKMLCDKYELIEFLMGIHLEMANGVPLKHCIHNSIVILYKLKQMYRHIILPDSKTHFVYDGFEYDLNKYEFKVTAARVLNPTPGIHSNVVFFDFKSLYPSIIRTFNLSPETLIEDDNIEHNVIDDIDMNILSKVNDSVIRHINVNKKFRTDAKGIYPEMCELLVNRRLVFQKAKRDIEKERGKENFDYKSFAYKEDNQKQVLNSIYGVGGFPRFELYNPYVAGAITSIGRKLITFVEKYCKDKRYVTIMGDTDSLAVSIPTNINESDFANELNDAIKKYVIEKWPKTEKTYCLYFEYQKTLTKFAMKEAKKRYFGIDKNNKFLVKGFPIVQHSTPIYVKKILSDVFLALLNDVNIEKIKDDLNNYRREFKNMKPFDIGISLRLARNVEEYTTNVQHVNAARYSNEFLKTTFSGDSIGKFVYIDKVCSGFPDTEYIMLEETTTLPEGFVVDYERMWQKLVVDVLKTIEELTDLKVKELTRRDKNLNAFM